MPHQIYGLQIFLPILWLSSYFFLMYILFFIYKTEIFKSRVLAESQTQMVCEYLENIKEITWS